MSADCFPSSSLVADSTGGELGRGCPLVPPSGGDDVQHSASGESGVAAGKWSFLFLRRLRETPVSKNTAMSKSHSQLPLHVLRCVYSCCHSNMLKFPPFPHLQR